MNRLEKLVNTPWKGAYVSLIYNLKDVFTEKSDNYVNNLSKGIGFLAENGVKSECTTETNHDTKFLVDIYLGKNLPDYLRAVETFFKLTSEETKHLKPASYTFRGKWPKNFRQSVENIISKYLVQYKKS